MLHAYNAKKNFGKHKTVYHGSVKDAKSNLKIATIHTVSRSNWLTIQMLCMPKYWEKVLEIKFLESQH
jgi:hypothetical protein